MVTASAKVRSLIPAHSLGSRFYLPMKPVDRSIAARPTTRSLHTTSRSSLPMKPGTPLRGLDVYKNADAPVALERSQYPPWLAELTKPLVPLGALRRMPLEEATDKEQMRYLKLTRRKQIKENNSNAADQSS